ncbi:hypothetical protein DM785_02390 [Deinococcus actinosclerus]|nr:hypothetical protein DM785_02390 [Deinococcus actinosclerus]
MPPHRVCQYVCMSRHKRRRIVVGSAKGGVGKTTIAAHLARSLKATLVDLDPEGSTKAMRDHGLNIVYAAPPVSETECLVLDVPANTSSSAARLNTAARHATHLIIPMRPGDLELDRLENTLSSIHGHVSESVRVGVLLNFAGRDALTRDTLDALNWLQGESRVPFSVIGSLPDRKAFTRALTNGFRGTLHLPEYERVVQWARK